MEEEWKDIKGLEDLYQVSNLGRVRSLDRTLEQRGPQGEPCIFHYKGKIIKPVLNYNGYMVVPLGKNKPWNVVHRLVARAFIPNPYNKPMVNHINGDKTDNRAENLEWCTNRENQIHAVKVLNRPQGAYQNKPVKCIETGEIFENSQRAAEKFNKGKHTANNIKMCASPKYPRKTCHGFHWEFVKS